jgi:hypothetical protein
MIARRLFVAVVCAGYVLVGVGAVAIFTRPDACVARGTVYLLAANSGALIRAEPGTAGEAGDPVIVFRPKRTTGWASQRLLMRFDLKLDEGGTRIVNTGAFCSEAN